MFKKFFDFISNKIKGFVNKIRKSKTVKNITWGVRNFLIPFIGAIAYCGSKIMKLIRTFIRWIKTHKIVSTIPKVVPIKKKPSTEVVNVF